MNSNYPATSAYLQKKKFFLLFLLCCKFISVAFCSMFWWHCSRKALRVALIALGLTVWDFRNKLILTCNSEIISCSGDISGFVFKGIVILLSNNILLCSVDGAFTG